MIEIKKTLFAVFICLMGHIVALAQKYQVRPLDLEQGLSCNYVVSIAQDKYGFLWFATEEGLNRGLMVIASLPITSKETERAYPAVS